MIIVVDEEDTPAKGTAAASSNTANRRNRSRMHDEIETEVNHQLFAFLSEWTN